MDTIGQQKLFSFLPGSNDAQATDCTSVRANKGVIASSYLDLATKVAELQYKNRDFVLLFRGQQRDYANQHHHTSLKPRLLRPVNGTNPDSTLLQERYFRLKDAEERLVHAYRAAGLPDRIRIERQPILRWSILQHYEVCDTPLLDVTHSLRIAASFASEGASTAAFVYVLGVPNLSGAITASAEAGLQIVRLASVCPPSAVRPHIQEGYLLGEYPDLGGYSQKQHYAPHEVDFGRRLVAKFQINPETFWSGGAFPKVDGYALYPNDHDPLYDLTLPIKKALEAAN